MTRKSRRLVLGAVAAACNGALCAWLVYSHVPVWQTIIVLAVSWLCGYEEGRRRDSEAAERYLNGKEREAQCHVLTQKTQKREPGDRR